MKFKRVFRWKRLTETDIERLTIVCNLTVTEQRILELRRKETSSEVIADEIGYTRRHMTRLSRRLLEKILNEL
jgi:DNA-binding MarR family transcriptional regulator